LSSRHCRAISLAKIAPPAGPDSTSRTGKRIAVSTAVNPPPDSIKKSGHMKPSRCNRVSRLARYRLISGWT